MFEAPYGRHWGDFSEEVFVVGGRPQAPSNYIFPVKHSRLKGAEQSQRAPSTSKGGHDPVPPCLRPYNNACHVSVYLKILSVCPQSSALNSRSVLLHRQLYSNWKKCTHLKNTRHHELISFSPCQTGTRLPSTHADLGTGRHLPSRSAHLWPA